MSVNIHLSNGPVSLDIEVDGDDECNTVGDILNIYREQLNIPAGATPTVNGNPVDLDTEFEDGDDVAFTKTAGSKG